VSLSDHLHRLEVIEYGSCGWTSLSLCDVLLLWSAE